MPSPPAKQKSRFKSRILKILGLFKETTLTSSKYTRRYRNWSMKGHQCSNDFSPNPPRPSNKTLTRPSSFTVSVYILPKTLCNWFYVTNFANKSVLFKVGLCCYEHFHSLHTVPLRGCEQNEFYCLPLKWWTMLYTGNIWIQTRA